MKKILLFFAVLSVYSITLTAQIIDTVAGNGTAGYFGDGGSATRAELGNPAGIALDSVGNLYIADYNNNVIRKVTKSTSIITTIAGNNTAGYFGDGGQASLASLHNPTDITIDSHGNMYIADYKNNRIRKVNLGTGIITTLAGNGSPGYSGDAGQAANAELNLPNGVAVDHRGNLYVADAANNCIRKIVLSTGVITTIAGTGNAGYTGDSGLAIAAQLDYPTGLSIDDSNNVYIADWRNSCIRKIRVATGIITTVAGNGVSGYARDGGPATSAQLNFPISVSVDSVGNIYITDTQDHRLRKVDAATGIITTIAGDGLPGYAGNGGLAINAQIDYPDGVTLDKYGNIYLSDGLNDVIQKIGGAVAGVETIKNISSITIYPNPSNGIFQLKITNYELGNNNTVEVYNILGEKVYSHQLLISNSQFLIDLSSQPNGIYLYRVTSETGNLIGEGKLEVQK